MIEFSKDRTLVLKKCRGNTMKAMLASGEPLLIHTSQEVVNLYEKCFSLTYMEAQNLLSEKLEEHHALFINPLDSVFSVIYIDKKPHVFEPEWPYYFFDAAIDDYYDSYSIEDEWELENFLKTLGLKRRSDYHYAALIDEEFDNFNEIVMSLLEKADYLVINENPKSIPLFGGYPAIIDSKYIILVLTKENVKNIGLKLK